MTHRDVDAAQFTQPDDLRRWHERLDARGLRAAASPAHEAYIDDLEERLAALGLNVLSDDVPVQRWTPTAWSLSATGKEFAVATYIPYSGSTNATGVEGILSTMPQHGAIGIIDVPRVPLKEADFAALDWDAPHLPVMPEGRDLDAPYDRIWLSQIAMREELSVHREAGAVAAVLVVDAPAVELDNAYLLYDGILRGIPALVVNRETGDRLKDLAQQQESATLVLQADVQDVHSRNLYVVIEGTSDELVLVQSHTDGTNALEDNGPEAIVAMAEYLNQVAREELPRGILLVLSTGHFVTHTAWGLAEFLRSHRHDLVERTVAALSIEHLGARAWRANEHDYEVLDTHELGCFFASPHRAVVDVVRRALERAAVTDPLVMRPFTPDETGESPDGLGWPGDGTVLWNVGHLPSANFITGPEYLLTARPVLELIDVDAMRRQTIAFLEAALELATIARSELDRGIDGA